MTALWAEPAVGVGGGVRWRFLAGTARGDVIIRTAKEEETFFPLRRSRAVNCACADGRTGATAAMESQNAAAVVALAAVDVVAHFTVAVIAVVVVVAIVVVAVVAVAINVDTAVAAIVAAVAAAAVAVIIKVDAAVAAAVAAVVIAVVVAAADGAKCFLGNCVFPSLLVHLRRT